LPADSVPGLLRRKEIVFVGPATGRVAPHHDGNRANDVDAARERINSDPYFDLPLADQGWMALLDTGVRTTHRLLCNPSHLCMVADCVSGHGMSVLSTECSDANGKCSPTGGGDTYASGHGTKS